MASCLLVQSSVGSPTTPVAAGAAVSVGGLTTYLPLGWVVSDATVSASGYSCPSGTHLLLTVSEVNSLFSASATANGTANAASAAIAAGLKVNVVPYEATLEDYSAISTIFGGILLAAVLVWSSRKLLDLFRDRPEA